MYRDVFHVDLHVTPHVIHHVICLGNFQFIATHTGVLLANQNRQQKKRKKSLYKFVQKSI